MYEKGVMKFIINTLGESNLTFLLYGQSEKGGLNKTSSLRGGCWKRGSSFFQGAAILQKKKKKKNELKSKMFNDKNIYTQKYVSVIT